LKFIYHLFPFLLPFAEILLTPHSLPVQTRIVPEGFRLLHSAISVHCPTLMLFLSLFPILSSLFKSFDSFRVLMNFGIRRSSNLTFETLISLNCAPLTFIPSFAFFLPLFSSFRFGDFGFLCLNELFLYSIRFFKTESYHFISSSLFQFLYLLLIRLYILLSRLFYQGIG